MTIGDAVNELVHLGDDDIVFAREPFTAESEAVVLAPETAGDGTTWGEFNYLLEVAIIREVLEAWSNAVEAAVSPSEATRVVIHYALHDAWPAPPSAG